MGSQTNTSFREKWTRNQDLSFDAMLDPLSNVHRWTLQRNGFSDVDALRVHLRGRRRLLDAGCGNGRVTALLHRCVDSDAEVVGIDYASAAVATDNLKDLNGVTIREADLRGDLSSLGRFDYIYCQEVLHHTGDARGAFENLCRLLDEGGEIAIYVYKRKGLLRELADEALRESISSLDYEEAMVHCRQLTAFGKALAEMECRVQVPEVKLLGIEAGEYDVQRLIYHFFLKCYWNDSLGEEGSAVVNYDWYHPIDATKHSEQEVVGWFEENGLTVIHQHVDHYGITVRGILSKSSSSE